ncbi:hypothetical protein B0H13DRAFT_1587449, partial [Mycena leptocephala]
FPTHCFRRGGAQYRFMFAPVGRRWTVRLQRIGLITSAAMTVVYYRPRPCVF